MAAVSGTLMSRSRTKVVVVWLWPVLDASRRMSPVSRLAAARPRIGRSGNPVLAKSEQLMMFLHYLGC
jgi:hypothetical protein